METAKDGWERGERKIWKAALSNETKTKTKTKSVH